MTRPVWCAGPDGTSVGDVADVYPGCAAADRPAGSQPCDAGPCDPVPSGCVECATPADASFVSMHQEPLTHIVSTGLDEHGNYVVETTPPLTGFHDQFAPYGVPGCVIGYPELRDQCQTVSGGFGTILRGNRPHFQFKVYVPAGTTFFGVSGYLPQSVQYAVAARLGRPPVRTAPLSPDEYQAAKSAQSRDTDFARLQAGEERLFVHDGGGSISLSGIARLSASPFPIGQWLYVRVLNGDYIYDLGALYEVDLGLYRAGYDATAFGADGDPVYSCGACAGE